MRTVGILIFPDVEVLDFCGPFEVFSVARKPGMDDPDSPLFRAVTIAESRQTIACIGGLLVEPHYSIHDAPPLDILVVPAEEALPPRAPEPHPYRLDCRARRAN